MTLFIHSFKRSIFPKNQVKHTMQIETFVPPSLFAATLYPLPSSLKPVLLYPGEDVRLGVENNPI
jgi:hypothetical protein